MGMAWGQGPELPAGPWAGCGTTGCETATAALGLCVRMSLLPGKDGGAQGAGGGQGHVYHSTSSGSEDTDVPVCARQVGTSTRVWGLGDHVHV